MKKFNSKLLFAAVIVVTLFSGCGSGKKAVAPLSAGSSFMNALSGNANLSTLAGLMATPEIGKLLGNVLNSPFTLLAPTNSAFAGLAPDALANLKKPENIGQLTALLKSHIVPGKLDAASLMKGGVSAASGNPLNLADVNLGSVITSDQANIIPVDKILK